MKAFYEQIRETDDNVKKRNINHVFGAHFHKNIEIFVINKGKYTISCNGETKEISDGGIAFFDSYDIHAYDKMHTTEHDDCVLIIPYSSAKNFNSLKNYRVVRDFIIQDQALAKRIINLADEYLGEGFSKKIEQSVNELILSLIFEKLKFIEPQEKYKHEIIRNLLLYANENFKENISLSTASKTLGYSKTYLSRTFHKYFKMSFPNYVNLLRLEYLENEKTKNPEKKITQLIFDSGFKSIQSYYRNKNS